MNNEKLIVKIKTFPLEPGVYLMKDINNIIIYVGKAKSLRKRVLSYFQKNNKSIKTKILVSKINSIEFIITDTEIEALLLESNLIKKYKPKFNVRLKDDKRFPFIAITMNEEYPRLIYTRKNSNPKNKYFGPYTDARAAKNLVELVNKIFKLPTCRYKLPFPKGDRPCINFQMDRCSAPCIKNISQKDYSILINNVIDLLNGKNLSVIKNLQKTMKEHSNNLLFEKAKIFRDIIFDIQKITEFQKVETPSNFDIDYIGLKKFTDESLLVIFEFRQGVLLGRKIHVFENNNFVEKRDILKTFILDYYRTIEIPNKIIIEQSINDREMIEKLLSNLSKKEIKIRQPQSPDDFSIIKLIVKNIDVIKFQKNPESEILIALEMLKNILQLEKIPKRIECFDISNLQGKDAVASMSSFYMGKPDTKNYRKFKIRGYEEANDPGMIHEAVSRRIQYLINENIALPDLLVIDGGPTQLTRAIEAATNFTNDLKIISIAKKNEEIFTAPKRPSIVLEKSSPALHIIQHIRDESHRFGITYHRKLRDKKTTSSFLDKIDSIGDKTKKEILSHFSNKEKLLNANIDELVKIKGVGKKTAQKIIIFLKEGK